MAEQIRFRKEDLLRAEYHAKSIYAKLYLVARKGEPVRTYEFRNDWLGREKEVCIISETETYEENMYVSEWCKHYSERGKYENMEPISRWETTDTIVEDGFVYYKPHIHLCFKEGCGNSITKIFDTEEEALEYLDSLNEELPMLVVVKE